MKTLNLILADLILQFSALFYLHKQFLIKTLLGLKRSSLQIACLSTKLLFRWKKEGAEI